MNRVVSSEET